MTPCFVFTGLLILLCVRFRQSPYVTEGLHLVQDTVDLWHHVFAVHVDGCVGAVTQRSVEHSTALKNTRHTQMSKSVE